MKKLFILLTATLLVLAGCDNNYPQRTVIYDSPVTVAAPVFYSGCSVPGMGYRGDDGRYYPNGWTYRCDGMLYRSGMPYRGSMLGTMIVGAYFLTGGPGYGHYGRTHNTFVINKNVTVVKKGSPSYKKRMGRYNKISKQRKSKGFVSHKEKTRRKAQSKRAKAVAKQKKAVAKQKRSKSSFSRKFKSSSSSRRVAPKRSRSFSRPSRSRSSGGRRRSDMRLKMNIAPVRQALHKVVSMQGVTYNWKTAEYPNLDLEEGDDIGLLAQDVAKIVPEVVGQSSDGYYNISYDKLVPVLIEAIKEQQKQIDSLREMIK